MKLFVLEKSNPELSRAEVIALVSPKKFKEDGNLLVFQSRFRSYFRLAYTKEVHRLLFMCKPVELLGRMKRFSWNKIYSDNFRVTKSGKSDYSEKFLADILWHKLSKPKVNLARPKTEFCFFFSENVYVTIKEYENKEDFESRKSHKRNNPVPISMHPKLARCMVNLTGIRTGTVFDPCVGTGGLLIEAGLMDLAVSGSDIDQRMIDKTAQNLKMHNIKKSKLWTEDATIISKKYNYFVTDLPYAKNTKSIDIESFYSKFMDMLSRNLVKRAVISFPDFVDHRRFTKKFYVVGSYHYYLHKSLSKKIVVLQRLSE